MSEDPKWYKLSKLIKNPEVKPVADFDITKFKLPIIDIVGLEVLSKDNKINEALIKELLDIKFGADNPQLSNPPQADNNQVIDKPLRKPQANEIDAIININIILGNPIPNIVRLLTELKSLTFIPIDAQKITTYAIYTNIYPIKSNIISSERIAFLARTISINDKNANSFISETVSLNSGTIRGRLSSVYNYSSVVDPQSYLREINSRQPSMNFGVQTSVGQGELYLEGSQGASCALSGDRQLNPVTFP